MEERRGRGWLMGRKGLARARWRMEEGEDEQGGGKEGRAESEENGD